MIKTVLIPLAQGVEELETVTLIDVLRRAEADVTVASIYPTTTITAAHNTIITADCCLIDCVENNYDLIVLPGGMPGAENLSDCVELINMLKIQLLTNKLYAAICASPAVVLKKHGLLLNKTATCYPSFSGLLDTEEYLNKDVVVSENCITSQGPGTALAFSLTLVEQLFDKEKANLLAEQMLVA